MTCIAELPLLEWFAKKLGKETDENNFDVVGELGAVDAAFAIWFGDDVMPSGSSVTNESNCL